MLKIKVQDTSSVDREELVRFYIKRKRNDTGRELDADEISSCERHIEKILSSFVTKNFLGYASGKLVGWVQIPPPHIEI